VVCEAFGLDLGVSRDLKEAPAFFGIYTAFIVIGAGIIMLPIKSLIETMMASQTLNGVLLPIILIVMLRLINDKRVMGKYVNGRKGNIISWAMVVTLIVLTGILVLVSVAPGVLG
jgi:Mn2+/Fe2+ NRAMP family transporter